MESIPKGKENNEKSFHPNLDWQMSKTRVIPYH